MIDFYTFNVPLLTKIAFNPENPMGPYFTIGEAVSIVALVIAAYQLVNPLIKARFDLRPEWLHWLPLSLLLISLVFCCFAALLPALTSLHKYCLSFTVFWEILAAFLALSALAISAKIALTTPKLKANNAAIWLRVLRQLMLKGTHADFYVITQLIEATSRNTVVKPLYQLAKNRRFCQTTKWDIYFARLLQSEINEAQDICRHIFHLLADTKFCRWCVESNPIFTIKLLQFLETQDLSFDDSANLIVGNLARQAVNSPSSHFEREQDVFHGFECLGNVLFGSNIIVNNYDPLSWISYYDYVVDEAVIKRHKKAITIALQAYIADSCCDGRAICQAIKYFVGPVHSNLYRTLKSKQINMQDACFSVAWPVAEGLKEWAALLNKSNLSFEIPNKEYREDRNLAWCLGEAVIQFYYGLAHYLDDEDAVRHSSIDALFVFSPFRLPDTDVSTFETVARARMLHELELISTGKSSIINSSPELVKLLFIVIGITPISEKDEFGSWLRPNLEAAAKYLLKNPPRYRTKWSDESVLPSGWTFNKRSNRFVKSKISN